MLKNPLVTIVTISYNQVDFLEETILSVVNQTYSNIEYIIFDGGSNDGSIAIIDKYKVHFAHINIGPDGGAAAALNAAFGLATGDYHAYINSDDVLYSNAVETWVKEFDGHPQADIVFGDIDIVDQNGQPTTLPGRRVTRFLAGPFSPQMYACGVSVIPQQASCCKANVFHHVGGFEENNRSCWDGEFFVDAVLSGFKVKRFSGVLAQFRVHSDSISGTNKHEEQRRSDHGRIRNKWNESSISINKYRCFFYKNYSRIFRVFRYLTTFR